MIFLSDQSAFYNNAVKICTNCLFMYMDEVSTILQKGFIFSCVVQKKKAFSINELSSAVGNLKQCFDIFLK